MATVAEPGTSLPPGPRAAPWRQTAQLLLRPEAFLREAHAEHGDVFTVRTAMFGAFVVVASPDAVREVFTGPPAVLRAGEANAPLGALLGESSVLVLDGPEHLRQRRLLLPPFHGARLQGAEELVRRATLHELADWPERRPLSLLAPMQRITLEVIVKVVFGVRRASAFDELSARLRELLEPVGGRLRTVLGVLGGGDGMAGGPDEERFLARRRAVDELLFAHIAAARASGPEALGARDDVLSMLLLARDEAGVGMTDAEIRDELLTLLLAGHETTATALAWTFERLLRTPEALERTRGSLDDRGWLDAVGKEALRVRPVLPNVGRVLGAPFEVDGHVLPAGTAVLPSIALLHGRAEEFPEPEAFRPERFLGDDAPSGYAWIPFGGGARRCIGAAFALLEMRVVLATVLEACPDLRFAGAPAGEAAVRRGIVIAPADGARVRLR